MFSFLVKLIVLFKLNKREQVGSCGQGYMVKWTHTILSTSLSSTSLTDWSTVGVADYKITKVFSLSKCNTCLPYKPSNWYP